MLKLYMKILKSLIITSMVFCMTSCATKSAGYKFETKGRQPVEIEEVVILKKNDPEPDFVPVGKVHVHNRCNFWIVLFRPSESSLKELLKKEAAELGANRIIEVKKIETGQFEWFEKHMFGTAVYIERSD